MGIKLLLAFALLAGTPRLWATPMMGYVVVAIFPHSTASYTEGFFFLDGLFYEGTGLEGHSAVLATRPETGVAMRRKELPSAYFGEGIIDWGPYLYEWTWKSHVCFVYKRSDFSPVKQFSYDGEGWGMTRTNTQIVTSDGSADLTFRDPDTFNPLRRVTVHDGPRLITQLNELEFVKGEIYANIWHSDRMVRISPVDGHVIAWIDLSGLLPDAERLNSEAVLNGIAYDAQRDRLFVTGKQWPAVFQIRLVPKRPDSK